MVTFIFRCPITRIAKEVIEPPDTYVPVHCAACRQFHHVNLAAGRVLGSDDE